MVRQIQIQTSPIKFNLFLGSTGNLYMLKQFKSKDINRQQLYEGPVYYIIEKEWYDNLPIITIYVMITRVVPLISLLLLLTNPTSSTYYWMSLSITVIQLLSEFLQMKQLGLRDYMEETLNILDFLGLVSGIIWLNEYRNRCITPNEIEEQRLECLAMNKNNNWFYLYLLLVWIGMLTARGSEIFKLRTTLRELYVIIGESVSDSKAFIIIYVYMLFAISTMIKA